MDFSNTTAVRSLYIHWPFCPYKCSFCPFVAIAGQDQFMAQYHRALMREMEQFTQSHQIVEPINTIYIGGGTPSTWPDQLLLDMAGILKHAFTFDSAYEWTIEVNPGTVRPEQLNVWQECGINRLSIGVQSLDDNVLHKLNRLQSKEQVESLLAMASRHFKNISVDLIIGLPGVTADAWKEYIHHVMSWPVRHVSIYFLTVHEHTRLFYQVQRKEIMLPVDDEIVDLYAWTVRTLAEHGFEQYEISNFARDEYYSRHNSAYWDRVPYKGFGLGACSFDGARRFQNEKNLMKYMAFTEQGHNVTQFSEELSLEQARLEWLMLGLRRKHGLAFEHIIDGLDSEDRQYIANALQELTMNGFLTVHNSRVALTPKGLAVENQIVVQLSR